MASEGERFSSWFLAKRGGPPKCPICDNTQWAYRGLFGSYRMTAPGEFERDSDGDRLAQAFVHLRCPNCNYLMLFEPLPADW